MVRKLVISDYKVKARNETGDLIEAPYNVKESIISILFQPSLQLGPMEVLERDKLANKINDTKDGFVLLEDADYDKLKLALDAVKGLGRNDVEFVKRILEAEQVNVKEK